MTELGFRGYIASRTIRGRSYPQRVQNLIVRDYATRRGLRYLLSATEHYMPGSYMILHDTLNDLANLGGIICVSFFQLPRLPASRRAIYDRVLSAGRELHGALEDLVIATHTDIERVEDLLRVAAFLPQTPFRGRDDKRLSESDDLAMRTLLAKL